MNSSLNSGKINIRIKVPAPYLREKLRKNLTRNLWYARIDKLVYSGNTNIVIGRDRSHESTSNFRMHRNKVETLCYN